MIRPIFIKIEFWQFFLILIALLKPTKWKSSWDLTEREKEKLKEERKRAKKKRKKSMIHQGLLDLMNISDPVVSSDNKHLRSLANKQSQGNSNKVCHNKIHGG